MATVMPSSTGVDGAIPRPPSHDDHHRTQSPPTASPHIARSTSQASLHLAPPVNGGYSPSFDQHSSSPLPFTAYPLAKPYIPSSLSLPAPLPHTSFIGGSFPSAPPMQLFQSPLFDARTSQPMIRTVSHAHPMNSATDQTESSRYSSSPPAHFVAPPTAGYPSFTFGATSERLVNPNIFNSYPMSRSTSGGSDNVDLNTRLLTPHYESSHEADLRKVSDSLGRFTSNRVYPQTLSPNLDLVSPQLHSDGFAHPQPDMGMYVSAARGWGSEYAMSAERGKNSMPFAAPQALTEYERQREEQILHNRKLLAEVGLGGDSQMMRSRSVDGGGPRSRKASTPVKKRLPSQLGGPVRSSPRIASQYRNTSYADLDGNPMHEEDEDEYDSDADQDSYDDDEFRPAKKSRGGYKAITRKAVPKRSIRGELSLYGLLEVYPQIPHLFPLFYYTLLNDLSINSDSVPLIGSIPSTVTPTEKADMLQQFFHRGRRVLAQLDAFTARCDKKYEGPEEKWAELDFNVRIAVRDVRRKVVERCENYKYTRRDVLDKTLGKGKWQPIETGMIEWHAGMAQNDPAGDLANVTLTLPTPPPGYPPRGGMTGREIRPIPTRRISGLPSSARSVSVTMVEPHYPATASTSSAAGMMGFPYTATGAQGLPPMYTEEQVPMGMNLPGTAMSSHTRSSPLSAIGGAGADTLVPRPWENKGGERGLREEANADQGGW